MNTRWMAAALLLGTLFAGPARADRGLVVDADQLPWPKLQTRIGLGMASPLGADLSLASGAVPLQGGRVLEDYYFSNGPLMSRARGGFRATSGLLLGGRGPSLSLATVPRTGSTLTVSQQAVAGLGPDAEGNHAVPYLGVGYTGLSLKGGWGFTADVGLMALSPGQGLRLGRLVSGQSLDEVVRDMQLTPVLQLGLSYSF